MAKRPRDPVQLAKQVFDIAIAEAEDTFSESKRHPSNRRIGGLKGGAAPAKKLSPENRERCGQSALEQIKIEFGFPLAASGFLVRKALHNHASAGS
jgi:hypothetical protein